MRIFFSGAERFQATSVAAREINAIEKVAAVEPALQ
jgi:hypothetical protein